MVLMSPLGISAFRLVVIVKLYAVNLVALYRAFRLPRFSGLLSYRRVTIFTILMLNLVYLTITWAPFTITIIKHNLQYSRPKDMETEMPSSTGNRNPMYSFSDGRLDITPPQPPQSDLREFLNSYITGVHDLITSSFSYSLVLTLLVKTIMKKRRLVAGLLHAFLSALVLVVAPILITLALRTMAHTTELFALHTPEVKNGYTLYTIICDVHITKDYIKGIFLELVMLLLVIFMLLLITFCQKKKSDSFPQAETDTLRVEDVACSFILWMAVGWVWIVKPLFSILLFHIYGAHWNNVICWVSHITVAVSVAFMPIAVFLARYTKPDTSCNTFENSDGIVEKAVEVHCAQVPTKTDTLHSAFKDVSLASADSSAIIPVTHEEIAGKKGQFREKVKKFYHCTHIFKSKGKTEDELAFLTNQDGNESVV